uniref:Uncharacterized protein n=1 Tax=Haptolina ericina TaxID=156174 RepID=A0A7S3AIF5_9EUKA
MRLTQAKSYVREAVGEVGIEVFREELIDVRDRLHDVHTQINTEVDFLKRSGQELLDSSGIRSHLEAAGQGLMPHLEQAGEAVRPHLDRIGSEVQDLVRRVKVVALGEEEAGLEAEHQTAAAARPFDTWSGGLVRAAMMTINPLDTGNLDTASEATAAAAGGGAAARAAPDDEVVRPMAVQSMGRPSDAHGTVSARPPDGGAAGEALGAGQPRVVPSVLIAEVD